MPSNVSLIRTSILINCDSRLTFLLWHRYVLFVCFNEIYFLKKNFLYEVKEVESHVLKNGRVKRPAVDSAAFFGLCYNFTSSVKAICEFDTC